MRHADSILRRLGGALGLAMLLALLTAGCGDDASSNEVPDAAERDGAPAVDARGPIDATPADADPNAPDAAAETCGGLQPRECQGKTFCDFEANDCGAADSTGVCKPRPELCQPVVMAVCGCDGRDYTSECEAQVAGTDVASEGACPR